jgi:NAD(P)-dependent dehydrogenase (short-subunit alcohol dehydrogenase family)
LRAVTQVLRDGVLAGTTILVTGTGELGGAVASRASELGAAVGEAPDVLVFDGSAGGMREVLDGAWDAIRPVATETMIPRADGRIVLLAPRPGGAVTAGVRAGLENLARTLSVEWARFQIRPVAILPGTATSPAEVAELVAFLASPAGEYYSGCAFELGTV